MIAFKRFKPLIISILILISILLVCKYLGTKYILQITSSLPKGIYRIYSKEQISLGDIVIFDVPEKIRHMAYDWIPKNPNFKFMKHVMAKNGDLVSVSPAGVYINKKYIASVSKLDSKKRPLPLINKKFHLKKDEFFVLSRYEKSFDSRYFGPIKKKSIKGIVEPFILFKTKGE